jgi:hypothetical protein
MTPPFDEQEHRAAAQAEHNHPGWAVLWGTHTRMYWGFPRFQAPPGTVIAAPDTAGLITRMQHTELAARAHMPRAPGTANTTSQPTQGNDNA